MRARTFTALVLLPALLGVGFTLQAQELPRLASAGDDSHIRLDKKSTAPNFAHRFWDRKNTELFAGVVAARSLDYASSRDFRGKQINERLLSNYLVDNRPLFVAVEAAGVAVSVGAAYLFHRTGHHKMERWVSIVHISVGVGGSVRNYLLKPDSPPALSP